MITILKTIAIAILTKPILWVIGLFLLGFIFYKNTIRKKFFVVSFSFLLFFSNPFIANQAMLLWEIAPTPIREISLHYDIGVVLSGVTNHQKSPNDRIYLSLGADRVTHTAMLYKRSIIKKILVTGGGTYLNGEKANEAIAMKDLLIQMGIPEEAIIIEAFANNTYENALFSKKIITKDFPEAKILLITSGFHMRRASACFKKQSLSFDVFSVDFRSIDLDNFFITEYFVPSANALSQWEVIGKEMVGYISYKLMNRL